MFSNYLIGLREGLEASPLVPLWTVSGWVDGMPAGDFEPATKSTNCFRI